MYKTAPWIGTGVTYRGNWQDKLLACVFSFLSWVLSRLVVCQLSIETQIGFRPWSFQWFCLKYIFNARILFPRGKRLSLSIALHFDFFKNGWNSHVAEWQLTNYRVPSNTNTCMENCYFIIRIAWLSTSCRLWVCTYIQELVIKTIYVTSGANVLSGVEIMWKQ